MPDALTIDFALTGSDKVAPFFGRLASLSDQSAKSLRITDTAAAAAARSYRVLNAEIEKYNRLTSGGVSSTVGGNVGGGTGAFRAGAASARQTRFVAGPFQRQEMLSRQMMGATSAGNGRAQADIALAQVRNEKQLERVMAGPKGLGAKFLDVLKTSRFGVGAGGKMEMMPLVGRTAALAAEVIGPELMALANPVTAVAAAMVAAGAATLALAKNASELGMAFASRGFATGNLGAGGALAGMVGGADAASKANAFNEAITGGGMGQAYGLTLGQFNISGAMGKVDKATQYAAAVDKLREIYKRSPEEAMRVAGQTNLTSSLPMAMMSDQQYAYTKTDAAAQSKVMNADFLKHSTDFDNSMARTKQSFDALGAAIGAPFLVPLQKFADGLADIVYYMTGASPLHPQDAPGAAGKDAAQTNSQDKLTKSLDNLTDKIPGDFGSDPQGRRAAAFPTAAGRGSMNGPMGTRDSYVYGAFRQGAFS